MLCNKLPFFSSKRIIYLVSMDFHFHMSAFVFGIVFVKCGPSQYYALVKSNENIKDNIPERCYDAA